jgi:hypothetical protein
MRVMEDSEIPGHLHSPKANLISNDFKSKFSFPSPGEERRSILELTDQQVNCMEKSVEEGDRFKAKNK